MVIPAKASTPSGRLRKFNKVIKRLVKGTLVGRKRLVSMTLLKNVVLWDGSPPRSTGVPNLFGVSPQRGQFADQNAPNKLGTPTKDAFFNRILNTVFRYADLLGRRSLPYLLGLSSQRRTETNGIVISPTPSE